MKISLKNKNTSALKGFQVKQLIYLTILLISLPQFSCDPCYGIDCFYDNYKGQFRIIDKTNGTDLVFGQTSIYNKNKINFFSLNGKDTTFFTCIPQPLSEISSDSILLVNFFSETSKPIFLQLNDLDIDTLIITYKSRDTKCCGKITEITNFNYNSSIDLPGDRGTVVFKK